MPVNPSKAQRAASRRNGARGGRPKATHAKAAAPAKRRRNQETKSVKAFVKVLQARWGVGSNTLYAHAGCLTCSLSRCLGKSLSPTAPHADLPRECLDLVFRALPTHCTYHLFGYCCAPMPGNHQPLSRRQICITDYDFPENFRRSSAADSFALLAAEVDHRKQIAAKKHELLIYISRIRTVGLTQFHHTPRSNSVFRFFQHLLPTLPQCKYDTSTHSRDQDEAVHALLEGALDI